MKKLRLFFKSFFLMCVTLTLAANLTSCVKDSCALKKIRLSEVTRSVFYAPQYVALGLDYFKNEGLDIELSTAEGSEKSMTALLASKADICLLGSSSVISVYSGGKKDFPVIFSQITQRDGSFLMGRTPDFEWENLRGKEIIAGRKGGVPEMTLEYILKKHNLDPLKDVKLLNNIQFNLMGVAFKRGIGDYTALFEPTASFISGKKDVYILKALGKECEKVCYTCYCCSQNYISENPHVIKNFLRAIYKSQKWIKTHSASETAKVIAPYFADADENLLTLCVKNYLDSDVWCDNPSVSEEAFDLMQEIMINARELEVKADFGKIVKNELAEETIRSAEEL